MEQVEKEQEDESSEVTKKQRGSFLSMGEDVTKKQASLNEMILPHEDGEAVTIPQIATQPAPIQDQSFDSAIQMMESDAEEVESVTVTESMQS